MSRPELASVVRSASPPLQWPQSEGEGATGGLSEVDPEPCHSPSSRGKGSSGSAKGRTHHRRRRPRATVSPRPWPGARLAPLGLLGNTAGVNSVPADSCFKLMGGRDFRCTEVNRFYWQRSQRGHDPG